MTHLDFGEGGEYTGLGIALVLGSLWVVIKGADGALGYCDGSTLTPGVELGGVCWVTEGVGGSFLLTTYCHVGHKWVWGVRDGRCYFCNLHSHINSREENEVEESWVIGSIIAFLLVQTIILWHKGHEWAWWDKGDGRYSTGIEDFHALLQIRIL